MSPHGPVWGPAWATQRRKTGVAKKYAPDSRGEIGDPGLWCLLPLFGVQRPALQTANSKQEAAFDSRPPDKSPDVPGISLPSAPRDGPPSIALCPKGASGRRGAHLKGQSAVRPSVRSNTASSDEETSADPGRSKRARWAASSPLRRCGASPPSCCGAWCFKTHRWLVRRGWARREIRLRRRF
jgi:hypothetical protein